jgi:hypothetical protein
MTWRHVALLLGALAGCTAQLPAITPLVDLQRPACPMQPNAGIAASLAMMSKETRTKTVDIGPDAPCVTADGGAPSLYQAFALPAAATPLVVTVSSVPAGETLFAPRVLLLDGDGNTTRQIGADAFMFRGGALTMLVRLRKDERLVVVASDPKVVGQPMGRIQEVAIHQVVTAYPVVVQVNTGAENQSHYLLSHSGRIKVELAELPSTQLGP